MPTTTWNLTSIDGQDFLVISVANFRVPLDFDPSSNMFIAVAAPTGGLGAFPALVKGDKGDRPTFGTINFTALEADDATPNSATWTETSPGVWQLSLALHKGPKGDPGDTILTPSDFGTVGAGKILVINSAATAFELQFPKVGDRFIPATISNAPSGNVNYTLCAVSIPAQNFDWRPEVSGSCIITNTSNNVRTDLVARLNDAVSGNIVGRGMGTPNPTYGAYPTAVSLASGPPAGASATYDKVLAGATSVVYLRAERAAGAGTFTTTSADTTFCVMVRPIP